MAWVKLINPPTPPYGPAELAAVVSQTTCDGETRVVRTRHRTRQQAIARTRWATQLRQLAHIWHEDFTPIDRSGWVTTANYVDGARPGRKICPKNGWNQYAMFALAPVKFAAAEPDDLIMADRPYPTDITCYQVDHTAAAASFLITFPVPPQPNYPSTTVFYQIDPTHLASTAAYRFTHYMDYHDVYDGITTIYDVTFPLAIAVADGDPVLFLVRHHGPEMGAQNWLPGGVAS